MMGEKVDKMVEEMKKMSWADLYDKDNMRVSQNMDTWKNRGQYRFKWIARNIQNQSKVLDAGCGTGLLSLELEDKGCEIHGIDVSKVAIEKAKKHVPDGKFVQGFLEKLPYGDKEFDAVCCSQTLEHLRDPALVLKEMYRVLRDGGLMLVTMPIQNLLADRLHLHIFGLYEVIELFEQIDNNFKVGWIHKFIKEREPNCFAISLRKGGERNGRPERRI